jgi:hypothetical protein
LVHWPARLVRPRRDSTGASNSTRGDRLRTRIGGPQHHHAERHVTVVGAVRRVSARAAGIEADFTIHPPRQLTPQRRDVDHWARRRYTGPSPDDAPPSKAIWGLPSP